MAYLFYILHRGNVLVHFKFFYPATDFSGASYYFIKWSSHFTASTCKYYSSCKRRKSRIIIETYLLKRHSNSSLLALCELSSSQSFWYALLEKKRDENVGIRSTAAGSAVEAWTRESSIHIHISMAGFSCKHLISRI